MKKILIIVVAVALIGGFISAIDSSKAKKRTQERHADSSSAQTKDTGIVVKPTTNIGSNFSEPLLNIGFEKEKVIPSATLKSNYDKLHVTLSSGEEGDIPIQYEGGTADDRYARITPDPTETGNHVLHYWLKNATVPGAREGYSKGRIQLHLSGLEKKEVYARYRMYLHPDLELYRSYPKENAWFVISEFWSGDGNAPYRFLMGIDIVKEKGVGKPLYFLVSGDKRVGGDERNGTWKAIWEEVNTRFEVPVGEWIDMEVGYKQGDKDSGRFYLAAKRPSDPAPVTIFNITNWTYNPDAPNPVPLTQWQPLKLYTSGAIIDHIRNNSGIAQIYWDDLELFDHWPN